MENGSALTADLIICLNNNSVNSVIENNILKKTKFCVANYLHLKIIHSPLGISQNRQTILT